MIHLWLVPLWRRLIGLGERMPHALLFAGPAGLGKRDLADALGARLLCQHPAADGQACGHCSACVLRLSGNHPDLLHLVPAAAEVGADEQPEAGDKPAKAASTQIVIEQVRGVQRRLAMTGHQSSTRVVIVEPADAMNVFTANALLKLLEEPPAGCVLILLSSAPRRLLPTIRSRCQVWQFGRPDAAALALQRDQDEVALLALCGGMPLAAQRLARQGGVAYLKRFVSEVGRLPDADAVALAGQWESWLKSKDALAAGFGMVQLADWMLRWSSDLASLRLGGRVRFFPQQTAVLAALAARITIAQAVNCYNDSVNVRKVAQHPLNARLMLEDMLLRYSRAIAGR